MIVVPGDPLVASGPYRYLRHPNYVGVVGELVGAALMTRALITGPLAVSSSPPFCSNASRSRSGPSSS